MIRNLVFEGGGVKGLAYCGALRTLTEGYNPLVDLNRIENVAGTSAGAITAVLVASGLSVKEMSSITETLNFNKFKDNSFGVIRDLYRLFNKYGYNRSDYVEYWIGDILKSQGLDRNITFEDMVRKTGKGLYIVGTNISKGRSEVFSHENTPNMRVCLAVRISMSIPFYFTSLKYKGDYYADGGILNNFPIRLFDKDKFVFGLEGESYTYNPSTLGLKIDSKSEILHKDYNIKSLVSYTNAIIDTLYSNVQKKHMPQLDYARTLTIITPDNIGATKFDLTEEDKNNLVLSGMVAADMYLNKRKELEDKSNDFEFKING